ncbi:HTH domain-containing protein [Neolewinella sp.]|uniref:HTH domain-containing protein n=1 Tax=Neolewinella sp. TaxID=2993543 RepID=UPI003B52911A
MTRLNQFDRLHNLIKRKATGNSEELAKKLNVSERTVYNMIDTLKDFGADIRFSKEYRSFVYLSPIYFSFDPTKGGGVTSSYKRLSCEYLFYGRLYDRLITSRINNSLGVKAG